MDEEQAARLLLLLDKEDIQNRTIIKLLLFSGMRRGELCGLCWSDIDLDNAVIQISRSSLYIPGKGVFTDETKNESSVRAIKIPADAVQMLRAFRSWQNEQRLKCGDQWKDCGRVFTAWDGSPIHPDSITGWFTRFVKRYDLPPVTVHSLRHTNASLLIAAGTNIRTVSARLGNSTTSTTSNIYAHAIKSADAAAAEALGDILRPMKKKA